MLKRKLTDLEVCIRKKPVNLQDQDIPFFVSEFERVIPESYLYELKNVLITDEGTLYSNYSVISEAGTLQNRTIRYRLSVFLKRKKNRLSGGEKYLYASDAWSAGYFHWLTDVLQRLEAIQEEERAGMTLILPSFCNSFHLNSLSPYQLKNIIHISQGGAVIAQNLFLPGHISISGNYNSLLINRIRKRYRSYYQERKELMVSERIYISRDKAKIRRILNEKELYPILEKYQFKLIYAEDYSFEEQVGIFKNCKYLISMHGAGLTNMLFMEENNSVLEIRKKGDSHNLCYYALASSLNLDYYYLFGNPLEKEMDTHLADFEINIDLFEDAIRKMLL